MIAGIIGLIAAFGLLATFCIAVSDDSTVHAVWAVFWLIVLKTCWGF
jgi:hypothetical protein